MVFEDLILIVGGFLDFRRIFLLTVLKKILTQGSFQGNLLLSSNLEVTCAYTIL